MNYNDELKKLIKNKGQNLKEDEKEKYDIIVNLSQNDEWLTNIPYNYALNILSFLGLSSKERIDFYTAMLNDKLKNGNSVILTGNSDNFEHHF